MTPDDSKFIADVKEYHGTRLVRNFVERSLPKGEVGMTADMLHALWMKKLLDDQARLLTIIADRDKEIARLSGLANREHSRLTNAVKQRDRLRKMLEVARGALEYYFGFHGGDKDSIEGQALIELDRLEKESL